MVGRCPGRGLPGKPKARRFRWLWTAHRKRTRCTRTLPGRAGQAIPAPACLPVIGPVRVNGGSTARARSAMVRATRPSARGRGHGTILVETENVALGRNEVRPDPAVPGRGGCHRAGGNVTGTGPPGVQIAGARCPRASRVVRPGTTSASRAIHRSLPGVACAAGLAPAPSGPPSVHPVQVRDLLGATAAGRDPRSVSVISTSSSPHSSPRHVTSSIHHPSPPLRVEAESVDLHPPVRPERNLGEGERDPLHAVPGHIAATGTSVLQVS